MSKISVKSGSTADFFARGRKLAKLADEGASIPAEQIISFEDPADLARVLTSTRIDLIRRIKTKPDSITAIALDLGRDRSAVKRDIDALAEFGLVTIVEKPLPGHGRQKEVRAVARRLKLEAAI